MYSEIIRKFNGIYKKARAQKLTEPTAVTLATADSKGRPSCRVVLLKSFDQKGFVFYTNCHSRKGRELLENPWAALCFYWDSMKDQVRVEGPVEKVSDEEADAYWASRARDSQIGAWASRQSEKLNTRGALIKRVVRFTLQFGSKPIPRPEHWSGFRVIPERVEFWRRGPFRLHERILFEKVRGRWVRSRLYP